jgi:hypothetical protein
MSNNGCGQLGAIQTRGTCWFYSILNGFILSEDGQKILYNKLKSFYKKLKPAEKAYFDDVFNAPCPMKNLTKTKEIYFWKFIDQYLCFMSGPREASLMAGKSASLLGGLSLQGTIAKEHKGGKGAFPQVEIEKILDHVGFKGDYYVKYASDSPKFYALRKPQFVVVMKNKNYKKEYMSRIPAELMADPKYELMCASLVIANTEANNTEQHKWHAIAGFKCNGKGYIYDSNQLKVFKCDWWNRDDFINVADTEVAKHYSFFKGGQINVHTYAFAIFARKAFTKDIGPACLMKYKTKTPEGYNLASPNLGQRINNMAWLKPAQRAALKRKWARTEHRAAPVFMTQNTFNSILAGAKNESDAFQQVSNLVKAGYKYNFANYKSFRRKLEVKFSNKKAAPAPSPKRTYTFAEAKARLNQFTTSGKVVRTHQYSLVWKGIPMAQRKVLMHWRNTGNWLANNAFEEKAKPPIKRKAPKPKTPSPSPRTKHVNQVRSNFNKYWSGLTSNNRQVVRNYIAAYKSPVPSPARVSLANAKRNVNALKTAKARKEYKRARAVNMGAPNWKELSRYIATKNAAARNARAAKKSVAKK